MAVAVGWGIWDETRWGENGAHEFCGVNMHVYSCCSGGRSMLIPW